MRLRYDWDVFFGVGVRRCPAVSDIRECPHGQGGADHVSRLPAAWGDFDVATPSDHERSFPSIDEALHALRAADPPPIVMVASGAGVHAYWRLDAPTSELERIEVLNRAIRDQLKGDNAVDAARILRLAGTFNRKYGDPLPVHLLEASGLSASVESLEAAFESDQKSRAWSSARPLNLGVTNNYDSRLVSLNRALDGRYQRYLDGDHEEQSDSEAVMSVIDAMVKRHFTDGENLQNLQGSALFKRRVEKKGERHAVSRLMKEIEKARQEVVPFAEDPAHRAPHVHAIGLPEKTAAPPHEGSLPNEVPPPADPSKNGARQPQARHPSAAIPPPTRDHVLGSKDTRLSEGVDFPLTDAGNGELFAFLFDRRVRYDHKRQRWLLFKQHHWVQDLDGEVRRLAKQVARERLRAAADADDDEARSDATRWAKTSSRSNVLTRLSRRRKPSPQLPTPARAGMRAHTCSASPTASLTCGVGSSAKAVPRTA